MEEVMEEAMEEGEVIAVVDMATTRPPALQVMAPAIPHKQGQIKARLMLCHPIHIVDTIKTNNLREILKKSHHHQHHNCSMDNLQIIKIIIHLTNNIVKKTVGIINVETKTIPIILGKQKEQQQVL